MLVKGSHFAPFLKSCSEVALRVKCVREATDLIHRYKRDAINTSRQPWTCTDRAALS
jgi:hypothetical protein